MVNVREDMTHSKFRGIINDHFIANLLPSTSAKNFENQSTFNEVMKLGGSGM